MNGNGLREPFLAKSLKHWWQSARCLLSETPTWLCWHWEEVVAEVEEHSSHPHLQVRPPCPWQQHRRKSSRPQRNSRLLAQCRHAASWLLERALPAAQAAAVPEVPATLACRSRTCQIAAKPYPSIAVGTADPRLQAHVPGCQLRLLGLPVAGCRAAIALEAAAVLVQPGSAHPGSFHKPPPRIRQQAAAGSCTDSVPAHSQLQHRQWPGWQDKMLAAGRTVQLLHIRAELRNQTVPVVDRPLRLMDTLHCWQ
mmetsp:Transcript_31832/g.44405  ORF Transcript_31832/g.44405 Transcript_31832/m.44405 type:complete len:253 (+) Transcript_31832:20-778(+)